MEPRPIDMLKHQTDGQQECERVGDALSRDIRRRTVHGFKYGGIRSDVSSWSHPETTYQSGKLIGQDIAEQVGGNDHVELPRVHDELHRGRIHDAIVHLDLAFVFLRDLVADLKNTPVKAFRTLAL